MTSTGSVVVLGSVNMDLVVRQRRLPAPGETLTGTSFTTGPGGKGLNQAVAAARAGAQVEFVSAVGDDAFGRQLREFLVAEGVGCTLLRTVAGESGIAQVSVLEDGENSIVVVPGANASAELSETDRTVIRAASHLVLQLERPAALVRAALETAREAGVTTALTPAPVSADAAGLLDLVDILVPNETEARQLAGIQDAGAAAAALSLRAALVIVTCGSRGAVVARDGEIVRRVAARAADPVDTTGAGDTFVGVLAAWLAAGDDLDEALRAGAAAASLSITRPGASGAMPTRAEILAAL